MTDLDLEKAVGFFEDTTLKMSMPRDLLVRVNEGENIFYKNKRLLIVEAKMLETGLRNIIERTISKNPKVNIPILRLGEKAYLAYNPINGERLGSQEIYVF